jgi:PadR family transcriptional regulator PadR
MTDKGLAFYGELEATWNELANAVNTLTARDQNITTTENQL